MYQDIGLHLGFIRVPEEFFNVVLQLSSIGQNKLNGLSVSIILVNLYKL